jgi:adenylate kinase family enzyme
MNITVLVGLPGSGKTTLGEQLASSDGIFLDDVSVSGGLEIIKKAIVAGWEKIIISDVFLCEPLQQIHAAQWLEKNASKYTVNWIFFENSPEQCQRNVIQRMAKGDLRKVEELIRHLSKVYAVPDYCDIKILPVFSGEQHDNYLPTSVS